MAYIAGEDDYYRIAEVPEEWFSERVMGTATIDGEYAEICSAEWISRLEKKLLPHFKEFELTEFTAATLQRTHPRRLTQLISRAVYDERLNGIRYPSKYGHDLENWAIFEPFPIRDYSIDPIYPTDDDVLKAFALLHLKRGK